MVERRVSLGGAGADIAALKEMLYAQQELLQKLYLELDVEREASSTAASEALSMILRLQGQKAALTMESTQYKRMAEEKMCHAETSLALFEDLIYQKEMEIASLEFQVQAYRCKLLSLGSTDLDIGENKFPESLTLQTNEETGAGGIIRRLQSLPAIQLENSYDNKSTIEGEKCLIPVSDFVPDKELVIDQSLDSKKHAENYHDGDLNSYWEQIKKLDERVREISDFKDDHRDKYAMLKRGSKSRLLLSHVSTSILESTRSEITTNLEKMKNSGKLLKRETFADFACPSHVHDIFEVPQTKEKRKISPDEEEGEDRLWKPDLVVEKIFEPNVKDESESLETAFLSINNENKRLSKPPRDGIIADRRKDIAHSTACIAEYQAELQHLNQRIEQIEGNRISTRNEINEGGEEGLNLLKEIREKLNSIQYEMRSWRKKKSPPQDEAALLAVKEAMLYFW